jgi:GT2 family glycosyltransferase
MARALDDTDVVGGGLDVTRINGAEAQTWVGHPPTDALPVCMKYRPYATGANFGVRLAVWQDLGGFDESFLGGHEEVDFCWRAADRGHTVGFAEGSLVDYRLRDTRRGVVRQRVSYGRTYAQLYARFRDHPIPRTSVRHEVKVIVMFLAQAPGEWRSGHLTRWLAGLAWTWGRYRGDLRFRVRCPL